MTALKNVLYLASQSPRRRDILSRMRVSFQVVASSYEERLKQSAAPVELALEHAEGKARGAKVSVKARFVMGADTVVACAGRILGKPRDERAAVRMIQLLSGRENEVITGIALLDRETGILTRAASHSWVAIKKMNFEECLNYVRSSHPYDKAGGYAIQGRPRIARRIKGSYSNIVGFPRELVRRLLKQAGFFCFVGLLWFQTISAQALASSQEAGEGESARIRSEHTEASLVSEYTAVQAGKELRVALKLKMDKAWHIYWKNSGDSGLATALQWSLPEGFSAGPLEWPYPSLIRQEPLVTYGYHDTVWLFTTLQVPKDLNPGKKVTLRAKAEWLECEIPCLPGEAELSLELAVSAEARVGGEWQQGAPAFLAQLPKPAPSGRLSFEQTEERLILKGLPPVKEAYFFPYDEELFDHAAAQVLTLNPNETMLEIKRSKLRSGLTQAVRGVLLLTGKGQKQAYEVSLEAQEVLPSVDLQPVRGPSFQEKMGLKETDPIQTEASGSPVSAEQASSVVAQQNSTLAVRNEKQFVAALAEPQKPISLWLALAFAFLGGLILNLMPCVLPVLSLKILGFVTQRGDSRQLRAHGLIWTAGVLVSFWLLSGLMLALRWGGNSLGWGFHLQSPGMVAALAVIFLLLTLNMAGFFEVGLLLTRFTGTSSSKGEKNGQAFAAGVLAVVAATPCTAPFMGAAMGYALTQPVFVVWAVFTFLGLGMAFPFLALAFAPGGLQFLPKPGPWMNTFKKVLALPLGLTVLWLLWILRVQVDDVTVKAIAAALTMTTLSAIFYGRVHAQVFAGVLWAKQKSLIFLILILLSAGAAVWIAARGAQVQKILGVNPSSSEGPVDNKGVSWQAFSSAEADRLVKEGQPVFINFTARWCLSCQVNDRLVFKTPEVADAFQSQGIHAFKADWTSKNAAIAQALADYGRASVPLYVFYDGKSSVPRFLPEVLTVKLVLEGLSDS